MAQRTAVLFPGQGAYLPGALADVAHHAEVADVLDAVDAAVTDSPRTLLTSRSAPAVDDLVRDDPERLHLAIYTAAVAVWRLVRGPLGERGDVLLGHSVGELAALAAAGAIDVGDGARLLAARDAALREAPPEPGGMYAVRLGAGRLEHLVRGCGLARVHLAADNAPRQSVVSGPDDELTVLESVLEALGVRCFRLRSAYPFHHPALSAATARFRPAVADVEVGAPMLPVYSPTAGTYYTDAEEVRAALVHHLVRPVRFGRAVVALYGEGVDRFVECGPKSTLADLVAENLPAAETAAPLRRRCGLEDMRAALGGEPFTPAPKPSSKPRPVPEPASRLPEAPALLKELRQLYADGLEYPLEVLTADADLEADLAVDSIKQVELFARALDRYGLPQPEARLRITTYTTLERVAALLAEVDAGAAR
ncbi:acyltransferase domain-containing protein [Streptomyces sp. 4F14]|uniref:acyltransferase domain-containing protein n=1 Tax=Streptomyces sp. 4F14 TaxID=3394380 RepID=UPI003A84ABB3